MSNIANQLIAVVATLSGFVAHDLLSERSSTPAAVAAQSTPTDDVKTRALALDDLTVADWLATSPRAERVTLQAPGVRLTIATAPSRPGAQAVDTHVADARANDLRYDDPGRRSQTAFLR